MEIAGKNGAHEFEDYEEIEDPFGLPRPVRQVVHVPVTDPSQPKRVLWLSLRYLGALEYGVCADEVERMTGLYITGSDGRPPGPFPLVGGQPVEVSERLFQQAAMVYAMQAPGADSKQRRMWNAEYFVALSITMPLGWDELLVKCEEINTQGKRAEGNFSAPLTAV